MNSKVSILLKLSSILSRQEAACVLFGWYREDVKLVQSVLVCTVCIQSVKTGTE